MVACKGIVPMPELATIEPYNRFIKTQLVGHKVKARCIYLYLHGASRRILLILRQVLIAYIKRKRFSILFCKSIHEPQSGSQYNANSKGYDLQVQFAFFLAIARLAYGFKQRCFHRL